MDEWEYECMLEEKRKQIQRERKALEEKDYDYFEKKKDKEEVDDVE